MPSARQTNYGNSVIVIPSSPNNNKEDSILISDTTKLDPKWGQADPTHDPVTLANFTARNTDVLITTGPKAGTTWMQQILHQLRSGGDEHFDYIDDVVPWLEFPRPALTPQQIQQRYEAIANPRVFKTHCTFEQTPGVDTAKIILTFRDPRDCCISFYHHIMDMTDEAKAQHLRHIPKDLDEHVENWLNAASWYRNVSSWWPHHDKDNVLLLRYEDLRHDLGDGMDKIIDFLGWTLSPEQKQRALSNASFPWMKANAQRFMAKDQNGKPLFKPGGFIRKGEVGNGKEHLSEDQERRILNKAKECLTSDCLHYLKLDAEV
jgi:hypothetical protein